jgi:hypothetical protein
LFRLDGTAGGEVSLKYLYILQFRERHTNPILLKRENYNN